MSFDGEHRRDFSSFLELLYIGVVGSGFTIGVSVIVQYLLLVFGVTRQINYIIPTSVGLGVGSTLGVIQRLMLANQDRRMKQDLDTTLVGMRRLNESIGKLSSDIELIKHKLESG